MDLLAFYEDAFVLPIMLKRGGDDVDTRGAVVRACEVGARGANSGNGKFFVSDLVVFGRVVFGSFAEMRSPLELVEKPEEGFPPKGFEGCFDGAFLVVDGDVSLGVTQHRAGFCFVSF